MTTPIMPRSSLVEGLPGWGVTLVTLGARDCRHSGRRFPKRVPCFRYIHHARLREMYTALALLMVVSIAVLMQMVGLSPGLGDISRGCVSWPTPSSGMNWKSDLEPFKGLLLGLFFITVGAGIDFNLLFGDPAKIIGLAIGVMVIKGVHSVWPRNRVSVAKERPLVVHPRSRAGR